MDGAGRVFEYIGRPLGYRRTFLAPKQVVTVPIAATDLFYKVPRSGGLHVLVHRAVTRVACLYCGAGVGQRCRGNGGPVTYTHSLRRKAARLKGL